MEKRKETRINKSRKGKGLSDREISGTDSIENPVLEYFDYPLDDENSLTCDIDPSTLIRSSSGLDIELTFCQKFLVDLIGASRSAPRTIRFENDEVIRQIKNLTGYGDGEQLIWLPPDASINISTSGIDISFGSPITSLLCVAGRRSGKTTIASLLLFWLARRIILDKEFLQDVPLLPGSIVSILNVACDSNQARILFDMLLMHLRRSGIIPKSAHSTERIKIGLLLLESLSSSSASARGRTACGVCFDEFAHFRRTGGPLADRAMWLALLPSLATFGPKSLAIITTSPAGRSGVVWDLFLQRGIRDGMLTARMPTWVMNPNIERKALESEFQRDDFLARQEYGAEFLAPHGRFLDPEKIRFCVDDKSRKPVQKGTRRHIHVDLGLVGDATAIAIGYMDRQGGDDWKAVIDRVEVIKGNKSSPVSIDEIEKRILKIGEEFPIREVTFDQHQSAYIIERLNSAGVKASEFPATAKSNREVFAFLRDLINTGRISLPSNELLKTELENLEITPTASGFKVEAAQGYSDDCADAVACAVWCLAHETGEDWKDMLTVIEREW